MSRRPLLAAARELRAVFGGTTPTHRHLRDTVVVIAVATTGVDLLCALAAYVLERHVPGTQIHTFGSAAFWTTTQLLTVSSQLVNPLSAGGRVLDVFMEAYAISVVASLAGAFGSFLARRGRELDRLRPPG